MISGLWSTTASAQPQKLTPATLADWTTTGGTPTAHADQLVVPAGVALSRTYEAKPVSVHLVSHPYFSAAAGSQPALEVGPAILTFLRDEQGGAMILLGDQFLALPFALALDKDGRSQEALDFTLRYDPAKQEAGLDVQGRSFTQLASAPTGPLTVAVSAGANADWTIDTLEIETKATTDNTRAGNANSSGTSAGNNANGNTPASPHAIEAAVINAALIKIEIGDLDGAVRLLDNGTAPKDTLTWYQLAALTLLGRTEELKALGEYAAYRRVASAAVKLLEHGLKKTGPAASAGDRAEVYALLGYASDSHLGDRAAARQNYQRALQELPDHPSAKEALARFDEDTRQAQRIQKGGEGK